VQLRNKYVTGMSVNTPPHAKQVMQLDQDAVTVNDRTFGAVNLCKVPFAFAPAQNDIGRVGREANILGFWHINTWLNKTNNLIKVYQYWITPRQYDSETFSDADLVDDFYTRHALGGGDADGTWLDVMPSYLYDDPVNSAKFVVLKKKTFMLAPGLGVAGAAARPAMNNLDGYHKQRFFVKLNRKYTYGSTSSEGGAGDGEDGDNPIQPPVFWITFHVTVSEPFLTSAGSSPLTRESHIVTYFRDGESGAK
jgi:hypothetical protein